VKNDQLHPIQAAVSRFLKAIDKTETARHFPAACFMSAQSAHNNSIYNFN
jgi:hypothetical protein